MATGGGIAKVFLASDWAGDIRWARNRVTVSSDRRDCNVELTRLLSGASSRATLNQTDDESLRNALAFAERATQFQRNAPPDIVADPPIEHAFPQTHIWSDRTYQQPPDERSVLVQALIEPAEQAGTLSAGYLSVAARGTANLEGVKSADWYYPRTFAQCSVTVRDSQGTASGWAGASSFDVTRFDPHHVAAIALDKCLKSRNPVRVEPGRYTTILEPQALFQLVEGLNTDVAGNRKNQEGVEGQQRNGLFQNGMKTVMLDGLPVSRPDSRLGQRIVDQRLSWIQDPSDPDLGTLPLMDADNPFRPVTWVDHGVLTAFETDRAYALHQWRENEGFPRNGTFKITFDGPTTSMDEMIATTRRGLLVTRFGSLMVLDARSGMIGGVTRDGLWLIENGKVSKPAVNLRFAESPLFVLNAIEQVGVPVPIFSPERPAIVPAMKVRDFNFSSVSDAV